MKKSEILFLVILVLLLLTIPFSFLFGTAYFPGFQTRNYPSYFVILFSLLVIALFVTLYYWLQLRQPEKIVWLLFVLHLMLTIPSIIFLRFPTIFLNTTQTNIGELLKVVESRQRLIPLAWTVFLAGQALFFVYYSKLKKANRAKA